MAIADNIKLLRKERHMTQANLADAIHVSQQTIQRYESGEITNIPYDNIVALADALRVSPATIMGWKDNNLTVKVSIDKMGISKTDTIDQTAQLIAEYIEKFYQLTDDHQNQILEVIDMFAEKDGEANGKI